MHTLLKLAQLRWTGHVTKCLKIGYQRKSSTENFRWESAPKVTRRNPKSLPEGFQHTTTVLGTEYTGSGKFALPHQKGNRWLRSKEVCEAERKRKECKVRAKGSSPESSFSELTCSICNRQFEIKIGLISHQRTHLLHGIIKTLGTRNPLLVHVCPLFH